MKYLNLLIVSFILLLFSTTCYSTPTFIDQSINSYTPVYWNYNSSVDYKAVLAGEFEFDFYEDNTKNNLIGSSYGFCIDLQGIASDNYADLINLNDWALEDTKKGQLSWLLDNYWNPGNMENVHEEAGLQLALWDVIYSNTINPQNDFNFIPYNGGHYYAYYTNFISNVSTGNGNESNYMVIDFNKINSNKQEFVTTFATPEPASYMLMGLSLVFIGVLFKPKKI